jgi:hypothetical protein
MKTQYMNINEIKATVLSHPRNEFITFDRVKHEYFYTKNDVTTQFKGVTSWIGEYKTPFDRQKQSKNTAKRLGISQQEVLDMWSDKNGSAIDYGNAVHDAIEEFYTHGVVSDEFKTEVLNSKKLLDLYGLEVIVCEFVVYDESVKRASPIDLLCWRESTQEYVIVDTKTPEKGIQFEGYKNQKMLYPLRHLDDCTYNHYSLQTGVYRAWLKEHYGLPVANDSYLLYLRGTQAEMIPTVEMDEEITNLYQMQS